MVFLYIYIYNRERERERENQSLLRKFYEFLSSQVVCNVLLCAIFVIIRDKHL